MLEFPINEALLSQTRAVLSDLRMLYWLVGGAGSGKTTLCHIISDRFDIPVYDMDAHIYGDYHSRFTPDRHPANYAWSTTENGLAWLLQMSWDEFNAFQQAALPEYLDLLSEDLKAHDPESGLLIDGGIWHPALLITVLSAHQIVCLARPQTSSAQIWAENEERQAMQELIRQLPEPDEAWRTFLEFDHRITSTVLQECRENNIAVYWQAENESVNESAEKLAQILGIHRGNRRP